MNRLDTELRRLYLANPDPNRGDGTHNQPLINEAAQVRAVVLGVAGPGAWEKLSKVWQGVQVDWGWPAPAIAVSGTDGLHLWFSVTGPVPLAQAAAGVAALQGRYLGGVLPERVSRWPMVAGPSGVVVQLPGQQVLPEQWSAWVAPDLAAIFEAEPWLDVAPSPDAQADVLARLKPTPLADFLQALPCAPPTPATTGVAAPAPQACADGQPGPHQFLQAVMNDPAVDMQWRIAAATALLPHMPCQLHKP